MDPLDFKPLESEDREKILDFIRDSLTKADPDGLRRAVLSLDWVESGPHLSGPLMQLVLHGSQELALIALDGLGRLEAFEVETELAGHIDALWTKLDPAVCQLRADCIRVLGRLGKEKSVEKLAALILAAEPRHEEDHMAAVEGLVSLGIRGIPGVAPVLERLHGLTPDGDLRLSLANALRELNVSDWDTKGFLTVEARYEREPQGDQ
jgi:hypothetical protein